jgi:CheY-like chemotaxis protein
MRFFPDEPEDANRAQRLHRLLLESIEELHPAAASKKDASRARLYSFLVYRYVEGWSQSEIMQELVCSRRQLFREQRKALMLLAAQLSGKLPLEAATAPMSADPLAAEVRLILSEHDSVQPGEIVPGMLAAAAPLAEEHGVTLEHDLDSRLPPIRASRTLLRQVLLRSLSELITRPGTQRVLLRLFRHGTQVVAELSAEVAAPHTLSGDQVKRGSDGLSAVQRLVEMMGGDWQSEEPGPQHRVYRVAFRTVGDSPQIVLVVEDNEAVILAFRRYLAGYDYEVVAASTGAEALQLAQELQPAALTLDVMMPNQDGWETLQVLKNDPLTRDIPVIICSALDDPDLARSLGAAAYLRKPVTQADLHSALAGLPGALRH